MNILVIGVGIPSRKDLLLGKFGLDFISQMRGKANFEYLGIDFRNPLKYTNLYSKDAKKSIRSFHIPVGPIPLFIRIILSSVLFFIAFYFIYRKKHINIIHIHFAIPNAFGPVLFRKIFNYKVVITEHSSMIHNRINPHFCYSKFVYKHADEIVCVSESLKKSILLHGLVKDNVCVIPNIITSPLKYSKIDYNLKKSNFLNLIFVGKLEKHKGVIELINFIKLLSLIDTRVKFTIVGSGRLAKEILNLEKKNVNVTYIPYVQNSELLKWFLNYDFLVSFSYSETYGMALAEAISVGVPVFYYKRESDFDFLNDTNSIMFNSFDDVNSIDKVKLILDKMTHFKKIYNREKIIAEFDSYNNIESYRAKYKEIYLKLSKS